MNPIALNVIYPPPAPPPPPPPEPPKKLSTGAVLRFRKDGSMYMIAHTSRTEGTGVALQQLRNGATGQYGFVRGGTIMGIPGNEIEKMVKGTGTGRKMDDFDYIGMISDLLPKM